MAETPSSMIPLGTAMPPFSLQDARGLTWYIDEAKRGMLVIFICNHCPFVIHVAKTLCDISLQCDALNIEMVCINSNDQVAYPADSNEKMLETMCEFGWEFPYLVDETQEVATAFGATCTPDAFLFDANRQLFYRGQFDDSRPGNGESDGNDLIDALRELALGNPPPKVQKPAIGCNIKWKV